MTEFFSKADWEPYVGPQGGKGWRNVEIDEVVYDDQPPGGVSLPDEFPGELDPDFNLNTLNPDDQVLAITSDGEPVVVDADNPYISQDDVFGVIEEETEGDSIEEEWDERDPSELSDIPVGTEVRLDTMTETVTGEFEGEVGGDFVEEWSIDGNPFSVGELNEPDTELYVNEDSIPEDDVPDFAEDYEEFDSDQIGEVMVGTQVYVELDSGEEMAGEFQGQTDEMAEFGNDYLIDGTAVNADSVEDLRVGYAGGGDPEPPDSWENDIPDSTPSQDDVDQDSVDDINDELDELLNQDPVLTNGKPDPTTEGEQLVEDLVEKHDMPDEDWDFDPDETAIDKFQQDILALCPGVLSDDFAEYKWDTIGDFLRNHPDPVMAGDLYDVMQVVNADESGFDVGDEFSFSNVENVDVGQYVNVNSYQGDYISGEVVNDNEEQGYIEVEDSDGNLVSVQYTDISSGEVVDEDDITTNVDDLPENPTVDDIQSKIYDKGIDPTSVTGSDKRDVASILIDAKDEKGASNETIASVIADVDGSRNRHRIASYMMDDVTQYSTTLDMEIPMNRDSNVKNELKKIGKTFQEENPEYEDRLEDIYDQFAEWTGGTVRQDTAAMWAAAIENGADNVPEEMAGWVDELQQEDPELIDAMKEYSEMTSEVLEDMFGDSVMLYRGIDGDYGERKMDEVVEEGDATLDHRGLASWTLNPDVTTSFERSRGVMTAQEVDVDDIFVGFPSSTGFDYEIELVASGGVEDYSEAQTPDEVGDGSIVPADTMVGNDKLELFMQQYDEISDA